HRHSRAKDVCKRFASRPVISTNQVAAGLPYFAPHCLARTHGMDHSVTNAFSRLDRVSNHVPNTAREIPCEVPIAKIDISYPLQIRFVSRWISVFQRVVERVTVAIVALRISEIRNDRVRLDEAGQPGIVVSRVVVVEARLGIQHLTGKSAGDLEAGLQTGRLHAAEGVPGISLQQLTC